MNKILIDTNIILDIALDRKPFVKKSIEFIRLIVKNNIKAFVTATTVTDIYYITQKKTGHIKTIGFLKNLFMFVKIAGVDTVSILNALNSNMNDFEDAVQCETAKQNSIPIIITRNQSDFKDSGLKVFSPEDFINSNI
ncbi:MAG: PIN domain-containing protein [Bacteroidetes bacterium]|nr:MAG: PIN domain-containing protein [Bacteroidota bacterium]